MRRDNEYDEEESREPRRPRQVSEDVSAAARRTTALSSSTSSQMTSAAAANDNTPSSSALVTTLESLFVPTGMLSTQTSPQDNYNNDDGVAADDDDLCDPLLQRRQSSPEAPTAPTSSPPPSSSDGFFSTRPRMFLTRMIPSSSVLFSDYSSSSLWRRLVVVSSDDDDPSPQRHCHVREVIRRAGNYLAYATLLVMLVIIPRVVYHGVQRHRIDTAAYHSAGVMVCGTVVLSSRLVYLHLTHWYMPQVQKYVVRILWMVPLYAVQSWLSLRFHGSRIYIDTVRDFYEAYVIASFVYYLIELLGGEEGLIHILEGKDNPALGRHSFPLRLILEPWELGEDFMLQCKHGVLQYVVFKVVATTLTLFFESIGIYGEGEFHWMVAYPYLVTFQNVSVCYALYCLVMLYSAVDEELRYPINWRPLGKFLCVKGVVFFCWWQGVLIFYLEAHGVISDAGSQWSAQDVAYGLIDYCIVLEMVLFAIAHSYTFTYKDYLPSNLPPEYLAAQQQQQQQHGHHHHHANPPVVPAAERGLGTVEGNPQSPEDNAEPAIPPPTALQATQSGTSVNSRKSSTSSYRPPATLDRPMGFKDAFWSSTVPKETIEDIQRLRVGGDLVAVALRPRSSSQEESAAARRWGAATTTTEDRPDGTTTHDVSESHNEEEEDDDDEEEVDVEAADGSVEDASDEHANS